MNGFDFNKIEDFDKHINLSIPHYDELQKQIINISQYFIDEHSSVYDIGCSTGSLLKKLPFKEKVSYIGIDKSNLIPDTHEYIKFIKDDIFNINITDASLILSIFTLQFLSHKERANTLRKIKEGLNHGGCFIVAEKIYASSPKVQDIINSFYYQYKEEHFEVSEILKKEQQLRTALRINTSDKLIKECLAIGKVDIFWKNYNFICLLVTK